MKKKVLLMGASGSGKTSMRSLIFSNNPASLTSRLGATIDVEQNHVRFLGDLILNLWDCGGQDAFMDTYLTTQRSTIFQAVGVLIYVFDVGAHERAEDLAYFKDCCEALRKYSPDARVFLLLHKMDLVGANERSSFITRRGKELREVDGGSADAVVFGTSIYDESLYKAWSRIVHTIIPNAEVLTKHLTRFAQVCSATEVILFERTTFLVIATSDLQPPVLPPSETGEVLLASPEALHALHSARYERTSELIKSLKHACARLREEFAGLELELPECTAVLAEMTRNTYVLVIAHDRNIETAAIKINIRLARAKFEELQADTVFSR
ncbi:unnamed protein product [Peniophora sp. CBMAI 1063]|nr:unnamed protein product [Peniophora sp. CBMAI 1063]